MRSGQLRRHVPIDNIHTITNKDLRYEYFRNMMAYLLLTHDTLVKEYWVAYPLNYGFLDSDRTQQVVRYLYRLGFR